MGTSLRPMRSDPRSGFDRFFSTRALLLSLALTLAVGLPAVAQDDGIIFRPLAIAADVAVDVLRGGGGGIVGCGTAYDDTTIPTAAVDADTNQRRVTDVFYRAAFRGSARRPSPASLQQTVVAAAAAVPGCRGASAGTGVHALLAGCRRSVSYTHLTLPTNREV